MHDDYCSQEAIQFRALEFVKGSPLLIVNKRECKFNHETVGNSLPLPNGVKLGNMPLPPLRKTSDGPPCPLDKFFSTARIRRRSLSSSKTDTINLNLTMEITAEDQLEDIASREDIDVDNKKNLCVFRWFYLFHGQSINEIFSDTI